MKELVGSCFTCGKEVFCLDGFLNGVHYDQKLYCIECSKQVVKDNEETAN